MSKTLPTLAALSLLAALLAAFGLGAYSAGLTLHNDNDRYQAYQREAAVAEDSQLNGFRKAEAPSFSTPCLAPIGREESDLCAQWKAAIAAEKNAFWSKWSFWIAAAGSSFLLWQIVLTRQAVNDATGATEQMRLQNILTREAQRPWVTISCHVHWLEIKAGSLTYSAELRFENVGQSVATCVQMPSSGHITTTPNPHQLSEWFKGNIHPPMETVTDALIPGEVRIRQLDGLSAIPVSAQNPPEFASIYYVVFVYYRVPGEAEWRATERCFQIGRRLPLFGGMQFKPSEPDQRYEAEELTAKLVWTGSTT